MGGFSEASLQALRIAQEKDDLWDSNLAKLAGYQFIDLLRNLRPNYKTVVGLGAVGCQLASAVAMPQINNPLPVDWAWADLNKYGIPELSRPLARGQVVIVSGVMLPDHQLSSLVHQIRDGGANVRDMGVVIGEQWPPFGHPATANALGVTVHSLVRAPIA